MRLLGIRGYGRFRAGACDPSWDLERRFDCGRPPVLATRRRLHPTHDLAHRTFSPLDVSRVSCLASSEACGDSFPVPPKIAELSTMYIDIRAATNIDG